MSRKIRITKAYLKNAKKKAMSDAINAEFKEGDFGKNKRLPSRDDLADNNYRKTKSGYIVKRKHRK